LNRGKKGKKLRKREIYLKYRKKVVICMGGIHEDQNLKKGVGKEEDLIEFHQVRRKSVGSDLLAEPGEPGMEQGRPTIGTVQLVIRVTRMCAKQVFIM